MGVTMRPMIVTGGGTSPDFAIKASWNDTSIVLMIRGNADLRAVERLRSVLPQVHAEAMRLKVDEVVVEMRELEFMNSSCFKSFVTWLNDLQNVDATSKYVVRFVSDPTKHWQKRSLSALAVFAADHVRIDTTAPHG